MTDMKVESHFNYGPWRDNTAHIWSDSFLDKTRERPLKEMGIRGSKTRDNGGLVAKKSALEAYMRGLLKGLDEWGPVNAFSFSNEDIEKPVTFINAFYVEPGMTVLLMGQSNPVENGLYRVDASGKLVRDSGLLNYSGRVFDIDGVRFVCLSPWDNDLAGSSPLYFDEF